MSNEAGLFLASHLQELNSLDDEHEIVTVALATISSVYPQINETTLSMLMSQLYVEDNIKLAAIAYFSGAKLLDIFCECYSTCDLNFAERRMWHNRGEFDYITNSYNYRSTAAWITSLKDKLKP